jgi:pimeloyl-ACP methyl ester carboxylesterase
LQLLYLHGFASGPHSTKAVAFARRLGDLACLDLRLPSMERLRLSAMIEAVRDAIRGDCAIVGSSLGGLTAARVAERDPRVKRLVLLAPAFGIAARWQASLGDGWQTWRDTGWHEVHDYRTGGTARVDFGFWQDVHAVDVGVPDLHVPTLIFHGVRDDVVPIEGSRRFAAGRANVRLVELDDDHQLVASLPVLLDGASAFLDVLG